MPDLKFFITRFRTLAFTILVSAFPGTSLAENLTASGSGPSRSHACVDAKIALGNIANAGGKKMYRFDSCTCRKSEVDNSGTYRFQCSASGLASPGSGSRVLSSYAAGPNEQAACSGAKSRAADIARSAGLEVTQESGCSCERTESPGTSSEIHCMVDVYASARGDRTGTLASSSKIGDAADRDLCVTAAYMHMTRTMTGIQGRAAAVRRGVEAMSDSKDKSQFKLFDSNLTSGTWTLSDIKHHIDLCGKNFPALAFR